MPTPKPIEYENGYRVNFRSDGIRYQQKFPFKMFHDKQETFTAAEQFIKEIKSGKVKESNIKATLKAEIKSYILYCQRNKSPKTVRSDIQRLSIFQKFAETIKLKRTRDITKDVIRKYEDFFFENYPFTSRPVHRRGSDPNPNSTWEKYRQILSAYCNWSIERKYLKLNPLEKAKEFKKKYQKTTQKIFTPEEIRKLIEYFSGHDNKLLKAYFLILIFTGMRCDEALDLKWNWIIFDDINPENSYINIEKTKNYTPRSVPIDDVRLFNALKDIPQDYEYVFYLGVKPFFTESWLFRLLTKTLDELKLNTDRGLHSFRHSFYTHLLEEGASIKDVMELAGHKDEKTTLGYIHLTKSHKRKAIKKLPY